MLQGTPRSASDLFGSFGLGDFRGLRHGRFLTGWWFGCHQFSIFPEIYWELCHHPNWRTNIFFRGVARPPTSGRFLEISIDGGFHRVMDLPQERWMVFHKGKSYTKIWMLTGGTPMTQETLISPFFVQGGHFYVFFLTILTKKWVVYLLRFRWMVMIRDI